MGVPGLQVVVVGGCMGGGCGVSVPQTAPALVGLQLIEGPRLLGAQEGVVVVGEAVGVIVGDPRQLAVGPPLGGGGEPPARHSEATNSQRQPPRCILWGGNGGEVGSEWDGGVGRG